MDLRDLGLFLEFMIKIQPLLFLIISMFAVYLSFKMLSNAKASRAHEEKMKLAEMKMNIRSVFAESMSHLTEISDLSLISLQKLETSYLDFYSVNLDKLKLIAESSQLNLKNCEQSYKNYIDKIENNVGLEDSSNLLLGMYGTSISSPGTSLSIKKLFEEIVNDAKRAQMSRTKLRRLSKYKFHI